MYTILQEFVILKLYKVNEKRKKCFIIIFIYTMFFLSLEYYIGIILSQNPNEINALVYNICHMIYTFVTIAVIGTFAEGFLPRNFIKLFLYYDVLTTLTYGLILSKIVPYIFEPEQISISIYEVDSLYQFPVFLENYVQIILIMIITYVINGKVDALIKKIPDKVCILVLAVAFGSYIFKIISYVMNPEMIYGGDQKYENSRLESVTAYVVFLLILIICIAAMIFLLIRSRRRYEKILMMEMALQDEYYKTVADISRSIREIKHDMSNHIIVLSSLKNDETDLHTEEYKSHLLQQCDNIRSAIEEHLEWRKIKSEGLSDREKYEVFKYISEAAAKYESKEPVIGIENLSMRGEEQHKDVRISTKVSVEFGISKLRAFLIRRNDKYMLVKNIVERNEGSIKWIINENNALMEIEV